ncbi:hypothetical protein DSO57_1006393 [Entomophthora muscae]|uniref:Uncharacterized protein n=1 Tax=Entomophthora muscae TaxID=34485 RepID=A0ACC2TJJ7_9FUNG|nr:hypothetical protein DSO57_1006393 [Entomophthora muscae]
MGGLCDRGVAVYQTPGITRRQEMSKNWDSGVVPKSVCNPIKVLVNTVIRRTIQNNHLYPRDSIRGVLGLSQEEGLGNLEMKCGDLTVRIFNLGKAWLGWFLLNPTKDGDQEVGLVTTQAGTANNGPKTRQGRLPASPMLSTSPSVTPRWFELMLSICDWLEAYAEGNDWLEFNLTLVLNRSVLTVSEEDSGLKPVDVNNGLEAIYRHETKGNSK